MPVTKEIVEGGCYHMSGRQYAVERALHFLRDRVVAEAAEQNVSLSKAEIAGLTYSEPSATAAQRELIDQVDAEIGSEAYEQKIATLIRQAYRRDLDRGAKQDWDACLDLLRNEDLYILVMVQEAGVMVQEAGVRRSPAWYRASLGPNMLVIAAVVVAGIAILFTSAGSFLRGDAARAGVFVLWIAILWALGEWSRRRTFRKSR